MEKYESTIHKLYYFLQLASFICYFCNLYFTLMKRADKPSQVTEPETV